MTDPTATPATPATLRALLSRVKSATGAEQRNELLADMMAPGAYGFDACIGFGELREQWNYFHDVRPVSGG